MYGGGQVSGSKVFSGVPRVGTEYSPRRTHGRQGQSLLAAMGCGGC